MFNEEKEIDLKLKLEQILEYNLNTTELKEETKSTTQQINIESIAYDLGIEMGNDIRKRGISRVDNLTELPEIAHMSQPAYSDERLIFRLFASLLRGIKGVTLSFQISDSDNRIIQILISIAIKSITLNYISFYGRKTALVIYSLSQSERLLNFISSAIPIGIPLGNSVNRLTRRNLDINIYDYYKFNRSLHSKYPVFGFSVDNLQYSRYENTNVSSMKFKVPLVTTTLNWISFSLFNNLCDQNLNPKEWRKSLNEITIEEIINIISIDELKLRSFFAIPDFSFPYIKSKKSDQNPTTKKNYLFASFYNEEPNKSNMYYSKTQSLNPAVVSDLIAILDDQILSMKECEKKYWEGNLRSQSFYMAVMDGSPGKQVIRCLFGIPGRAAMILKNKGKVMNDSIVLVPGLMHIIMVLNQIVLKIIDQYFPWIFPIMGISNPFFKLSILKSTNCRKSYSIVKRCVLALINLVKITYELECNVKCNNVFDALNWAQYCKDGTFRFLGYLCKYILSPVLLFDRKTITHESALLGMKLTLHWTYPDHRYYTEYLSLFLLQYHRSPEPIKDCIRQYMFVQNKGKVVYNDEAHEVFNDELQRLVRSHRFVKVEHYVEASIKIPFLNMIRRSVTEIKQKKCSYPNEVWEEENAKVAAILFDRYDYKEGRKSLLKILSNFQEEELDDIDGKNVDNFIDSLSSKQHIANFLWTGVLK